MTRQIEIHEFSTGIVIETKADGSWFSRGFTGKYMNCTFDPIPYPIQEAISNRLFAIAEGASSDTPAIIGREVESQEECWCVVSIVTKARDESRSFSAYRYFCVEGKGNLNKILRFLKENPLQFNPLDEKTIGNPHLFIDNHEMKIPLDNFQDLFTQSIPVIIPFDRTCVPTVINAIAEEMAGENMTAWAYNVQALDKPASFYLIKPHDEKAEVIIRKSLSNQVILNRPIFEEQKIKTAVTSLCKKNKIKREYIQTLENALSNPDINDKFWQKIFDGQGLKKSKSEGIYNDEMMRLFTLYAIILPQTLSEFLTWLKGIKKDDLFTISDHFQQEILKLLTLEVSSKYIVERIELAVISIIPSLLKDDTIVEEVINLLKTEKSLWRYYYINRISKYIDHDLKLMKNYGKQKELSDQLKIFENESWITIRDELTIAWRIHSTSNKRFKPIPKYQVWVRLFDGLNESKLALFFAHVAYDKVPKDIFSKVKKVSFGSNYYCKIYDVNTTREVGIVEQFILELNELFNIKIDMKLWKIIILVFFCLGLGGLGGFFSRVFLFPSKLEKSANSFIQNQVKDLDNKDELKNKKSEIRENIYKTFDSENSKLIKEVFKCYPNPEKCEVKNKYSEQINIAVNQFDKTRGIILNIKSELKLDDNNMQKKLREILNDSKLNYIEAIEKNHKNYQEYWVKAIYKYQLDNDLTPDGIINSGGKTLESLKKDLAK
ncbi:hypothetical protein [Geminocystis sp. GBBB08]|uniref:hypothetical protein n=1 Tax=Geminocystis sp. GBBB08 TaxID=2604140 RepID=UPI0027E374F7|nr:hypothetical protein [Geminocystis sp. GBBB08]MBL1208721.1 hypothetical protein [Geminocystis sp. GBBB08]